MLYNEAFSYNQTQISYNGVLIINAPGFPDKIILNNISVAFAGLPDYSNLTTIAIVEFDIAPSGIVTISTQDEQAFALADASSITIYPYSENATTLSGQDSSAESGSGQVYVGPSGEIIIEGLSA
jgi:hypothetical protein